MKRTRWFAVLCLVAVCVSGCGHSLDGEGCETTCQRLAACGLLSDGLGADLDECMSRCAFSEDPVRQETDNCVADVRPNADGSVLGLAAWCGADEEAPCDAAAQCVRDVYGQSLFTDVVDLSVEFMAAPDAAGECPSDASTDPATPMGPCPENVGICEPDRAPEVAGTALEAESRWCERLGVARAMAWVETTSGPSPSRAIECATIPSTADFGRVEPGLLQPVVRVEGVLPAADEDAATRAGTLGLDGPFCWVFRGASSVRHADDREHLPVLLPAQPDTAVERLRFEVDAVRKIQAGQPAPRSLFRCEADAQACTNRVDDDGDGLDDCRDPECAAFCTEADNAGCRNGADDDHDGLTDCADPDCATECPESGLDACTDGIDNDLDRINDCGDADCAPWCGVTEPAAVECRGQACEPGFPGPTAHRDCDVECADADEACIAGLITFCGMEPSVRCDDGIDNDGDGLTDAGDPDCAL